MMITFGPVPSRRLGQSLGINTIPPKVCTYSCLYCQVGTRGRMTTERQAFYGPEELYDEVKHTVEVLEAKNEPIDYLTIVPDGEPTLDENLAEELDRLNMLPYKTAVITNSSLLRHKGVRDALCKADWVSVKVDAATPEVWKKINRPHKDLSFETISEGLVEFARGFPGTLATESMFVRGVNDTEEEVEKIAKILEAISPHSAYLAVPTRPPAVGTVTPATSAFINTAYQIVASRNVKAECLLGTEEGNFGGHRTIDDDILSITSVHPMSEDAVKQLLEDSGADWNVVERLIKEDKLVETFYRDSYYYIRKRSTSGMGAR